MTKPFKRYETSLKDDPVVVEDIDDCQEVYGDHGEFDYPDDTCDASPSGHHEYDALRDPERCKHCGRKT